MFKIFLISIITSFPILTKAQTCWRKSLNNDSVFVIQEKYDIANDTMCVILVKENDVDCNELLKLKAMKHETQNREIEILIARGFRIEIYRKAELF